MAKALAVKTQLFEYDEAVRNSYPVFCGVDEAGRGPLAGDVYAAAVVLPPDVVIPGLDDSKKLTEKRREALYDEIIAKASACCIAAATVEEIEQLNILQAAMLAMTRAVSGLDIPVQCALIDGNRLPRIGTCWRWISSTRNTAFASIRATAPKPITRRWLPTASVRCIGDPS